MTDTSHVPHHVYHFRQSSDSTVPVAVAEEETDCRTVEAVHRMVLL